MNKVIINCPECDQKLRVPAKKHIVFNCTKCKAQMEYNDTGDIEDINEEEFKPSNFRIGVHIIFGAILGASFGAMLVAAIAALVGGFYGLFTHKILLLKAFHDNRFWGLMNQCVVNIGNGATYFTVKWVKYGAHYGPYIFAFVGWILSYIPWEKEEKLKIIKEGKS